VRFAASRAAEGQALGGGLRGPRILAIRRPRCGSSTGETPGAVLGGKAPGIERVADEGAVGLPVVGLHLGHGDHFIDDAGQFEAGLRAVDLRLEDACG
jgi:hypothetical protein